MIVPLTLKCFKAYDIREKLGEELNERIVYRIGRVVAQSRNAKTVVVGWTLGYVTWLCSSLSTWHLRQSYRPGYRPCWN